MNNGWRFRKMLAEIALSENACRNCSSDVYFAEKVAKKTLLSESILGRERFTRKSSKNDALE
ncbi:MAG TPA: hypothetical protein GX688_02865 [Clostridiales bacterium]|jgi:hypothetical protein|nr:hypothetical protein [Clostridiales bacterium]